MCKTGRENKKYSAEFKMGVIIDMREHHLGYRETARKYWKVTRGQDLNYINTVKRWERIYLEEGSERETRQSVCRQRHTERQTTKT